MKLAHVTDIVGIGSSSSTGNDSSGSATGSDVRRHLVQACAWVFALSFVVFALSPVITNYDSYSTFPTAVSLVNHQTLSLDVFGHVPALVHSYTVARTNGHLLTAYPWAPSLFFLPSVVAIDLLHVVGGPSADHLVAANDMGIVQMESASLVAALACAAMAWLAFDRFGGSGRRRRRLAILCGLVFAFGTSVWSIASRSMWQHGPSLLLLALGLVCLNRTTGTGPSGRGATKLALLCGALFAAALAVRPTNIIPLAVVAMALLVTSRSLVWRFVVGAVVFFVPWMAVTYVTYGSLVQPYDASDNRALQHAVLEALAANLVSPARGLLVFSPIVLAAVGGVVLARRSRRLDLVEWVSLIVVPLLWILVSGFGTEWWAGATYGPRFMSETLPFIFVLSLPLVDWLMGTEASFRASWRASRTRRAVLVVMAVLVLTSVAFNAEGGVLRSTTCWNGKPGSTTSVDEDPSRVWSWSDAQFLTGFRSLGSGSLRTSVLSTCPQLHATTSGAVQGRRQ